jgi:hypothetical protein
MKTKVLILLFAFVFLTGCNWIDQIKGLFTSSTNKVVQVLDQGISTLNSQSANWQEVLNKIIQDLPTDVSNTVKSDVSNLMQRTVASTSGEVRCDADFFRVRVQQWLQEIKAKYLGGNPPVIEPHLCSVVPGAIDMGLPPNQRNLIEFFGYDFDQAQIQVFVKTNNGQLNNVSQYLQKQTHYHMTLNLGSNGVVLDANSQAIVLRWKNADISTISVIQPAPKVCETSYKEFTPNAISYIPPHVGNGDTEFDGNGPNVYCSVSLLNYSDHIDVCIYMDARETQSDWTEARGTKQYTIFNADPDKTIEKIVTPVSASFSYTDTNHDDDFFGGNGCVSSFNFVGDTDGDEAGTRTCVTLAFNSIRLQIKEKGDCVSTESLKAAFSQNKLSTMTIQRIQQVERMRNIRIFH